MQVAISRFLKHSLLYLAWLLLITLGVLWAPIDYLLPVVVGIGLLPFAGIAWLYWTADNDTQRSRALLYLKLALLTVGITLAVFVLDHLNIVAISTLFTPALALLVLFWLVQASRKARGRGRKSE